MTSGDNGKFVFTTKTDATKKYIMKSSGGVDVDTNEDFSGVEFSAPVDMFGKDTNNSVVSSLTSLVTQEVLEGTNSEVAMFFTKEKLGIKTSELKIDPTTDVAIQRMAMKLSLMSKEGISFHTIENSLNETSGIDDGDIDLMTDDESIRIRLKDANADLAGASTFAQVQTVYRQKRITREIIADMNLTTSNADQFSNAKALAVRFNGEDSSLTQADILASLNSVQKSDLNVSSVLFNAFDFNVSTVSTEPIVFSDNLKVLYYEIDNPITLNNQLLAYDFTTRRSSVVNTNVILKDRVFIFEGVKDGNKERYTKKSYGMYLDPEQASETRVGTSRRGQQFTYNFFTDNALMKFDASKPSDTAFIFQSSQIPQGLRDLNITKIGNNYEVYENIVDVNNSYVRLDGYNSIPDTIRREDENAKLRSDITVRLGNSKAIAGRPLLVVKDSLMKTSGVLISHAAPFIQNDSNGTYSLKLYNSLLTSSINIANGAFYFATQNDTMVYLYKEGSNQLWSLPKVNGSSLSAVTGITLAGIYNHSTHGKASVHGGPGILSSATTLSGLNRNLSDGANAYVAFYYDLHDDIADIFIFGRVGGYKSSQVFKLSGTTGTKIYDNADGVDHSLANALNTEKNTGHINLIAVSNDLLYAEIGWHDGNATLGGTCTSGFPFGNNSRNCVKVRYGFLDTTVTTDVNDTTPLNYDNSDNTLDKEMQVTNIPYYVSRRVAPFASDGKLYVSLFTGGTRTAGYTHNLYTFNLGETNTSTVKEGRTYFIKSGKGANGDYSGKVISWSKSTSTITRPNGTLVADTSPLTNGGRSVSARTNGVPLAGVGTIGMLKNDMGSHNFELFAVDGNATSDSFQAVDLAPFGGWIYE